MQLQKKNQVHNTMFCVKKVSLNAVHLRLFNFISHRCGRCNTVNCNYAKHHSFDRYHFKQQFFISHLIIVHVTGKVFPKVQNLDGVRNTASAVGVFPSGRAVYFSPYTKILGVQRFHMAISV